MLFSTRSQGAFFADYSTSNLHPNTGCWEKFDPPPSARVFGNDIKIVDSLAISDNREEISAAAIAGLIVPPDHLPTDRK
jgi:hypothetical protein